MYSAKLLSIPAEMMLPIPSQLFYSEVPETDRLLHYGKSQKIYEQKSVESFVKKYLVYEFVRNFPFNFSFIHIAPIP